MKINSVSVSAFPDITNLPDTKLQMFVDVERNKEREDDKKRHGEYFLFSNILKIKQRTDYNRDPLLPLTLLYVGVWCCFRPRPIQQSLFPQREVSTNTSDKR